jgi:hypothetical protein
MFEPELQAVSSACVQRILAEGRKDERTGRQEKHRAEQSAQKVCIHVGQECGTEYDSNQRPRAHNRRNPQGPARQVAG